MKAKLIRANKTKKFIYENASNLNELKFSLENK